MYVVYPTDDDYAERGVPQLVALVCVFWGGERTRRSGEHRVVFPDNLVIIFKCITLAVALLIGSLNPSFAVPSCNSLPNQIDLGGGNAGTGFLDVQLNAGDRVFIANDVAVDNFVGAQTLYQLTLTKGSTVLLDTTSNNSVSFTVPAGGADRIRFTIFDPPTEHDWDVACTSAGQSPTVTSVSPNSGAPAGGTSVTIMGANLVGATAVKFGGTDAASFSFFFDPTNSNNAQITATSPAGTGTVDITVTTAAGTSAISSSDLFNYGTATATDSQNLRSLQIAITKLVATTSGATIGNAIDQGIDDGFSNGGSLPNFGSNGGFIGFTDDYFGANANAQASSYPAEFRRFNAGTPSFGDSMAGRSSVSPVESQRDTRFNEAFSALAYNGDSNKVPALSPKLERDWNMWVDLRGTGWKANDTSGAGNDLRGGQVNITAGLGHKLNTDTLIGVVAGYEYFKYDVAALAGSLKGDGETIGVYGARRFGNLRFDAALAWSYMNYSATAGTATGSFTGSRWLAKTGLTGNYNYGHYVLQPSVKLYVLWEDQKAWTDSLGTLQNSRNFSAGRTALGAQIGRTFVNFNGWTVTPYGGLYGDWRFSTDNAIPTGSIVANIKDGWSGRAATGVSATGAKGVSVMFGSELGGLGASYKIWSGNLRLTWLL